MAGVRFSLETHSGPLSFSQAPRTHLVPARELGTRILKKAVVRLEQRQSETCPWFKKQTHSGGQNGKVKNQGLAFHMGR